MAVVQPWKLGVDLTSVTLTGQTVGADGTLTPSTVYTLTALIDSLAVEDEVETVEVRAVNSTARTELMIGTGVTVRVREIKKRNAASKVGLLKKNFTHAVLEYIEGTETRNITGLIGNVSDGTRDKGQNNAEVVLLPCGIAATWSST